MVFWRSLSITKTWRISYAFFYEFYLSYMNIQVIWNCFWIMYEVGSRYFSPHSDMRLTQHSILKTILCSLQCCLCHKSNNCMCGSVSGLPSDFDQLSVLFFFFFTSRKWGTRRHSVLQNKSALALAHMIFIREGGIG